MFLSTALLCFFFTLSTGRALYLGPFVSSKLDFWSPLQITHPKKVTFYVNLALKNVQQMHRDFLQVSTPRSGSYGKHLSVGDIKNRYGLGAQLNKLLDFFKTFDDGKALVEPNLSETMIKVTASAEAIEQKLNTKLFIFRHDNEAVKTRYIRAAEPIELPEHIKSLIAFISLNSPVDPGIFKRVSGVGSSTKSQVSKDAAAASSGATYNISVSSGNLEAIIGFSPFCGDGEKNAGNIIVLISSIRA